MHPPTNNDTAQYSIKGRNTINEPTSSTQSLHQRRLDKGKPVSLTQSQSNRTHVLLEYLVINTMGMMEEEEQSTTWWEWWKRRNSQQHDGNDGRGGTVNNMMGMMEEEEQSTTWWEWWKRRNSQQHDGNDGRGGTVNNMMGMMEEEEQSTTWWEWWKRRNSQQHDGNDGRGGTVNNMMGMMEEEEQSTTWWERWKIKITWGQEERTAGTSRIYRPAFTYRSSIEPPLGCHAMTARVRAHMGNQGRQLNTC